jgi:hypothetical protein
LSWDSFLEVGKYAYRHDVNAGLQNHLPEYAPEFRLPISVAKEICREAEFYPVVLVGMAETILMKDAGSKVEKVSDAAHRERWFSGTY